MVPPSTFIPLAEETGSIVSIGDWVLRQACGEAATWHRDGHGDLTISVNLSPQQVHHVDLRRLVCEVVSETRLQADRLQVEITEGIAMQDAARMVELFAGLGSLGVRVAIDDFGTGYSSLAYLKRFAVHTLKLDRAFVKNLDTDPEGGTVARAIVSLAAALEIDVVAEGVETIGQRDRLIEHGCVQAQGFLFSPAVPAAGFRELLALPDLMPVA